MSNRTCIEALESVRNGDWDFAHRLVQEMNTPEAAWIHAYLHRVEGDLANAAYWYRIAGRPEHSGPLDEEWQELHDTLC